MRFFLFHSSSINSVLLKTVPKYTEKCNNDMKFGPDRTNKRNYRIGKIFQ